MFINLPCLARIIIAIDDSCLTGYVHCRIFIIRINCIGAREAGRQYARRCDLQMAYEETFDMEERDEMLSRQTVVVFCIENKITLTVRVGRILMDNRKYDM